MKISEKDIIEIISKNNNFREEILVEIGQDASVIFPKQDSYIITTTDTMVLNTHFESNIKPYDLGYIAAASNISDLSAMGAHPAFALINLTIENPTKEYIENIVDGYNSVFKNYPVSIIGGDTTFGPTSLTMTLIGYSNDDNFMPTSNAKVGDIIFVSGYIGESLALKKEKKYNLPICRNELGKILPEYANCCTDMSDGIFASLNSIMEKSAIGIDIQVENIPISNNVKNLLNNNSITWEDILSYGEDYELIFTINQEKLIIFKSLCKNIGIDIYEIGKISKDKNININFNNKLMKINTKKKFEHFKND